MAKQAASTPWEITQQEVSVSARKGVRNKPMFASMPLANHMTPILHVAVGKGNDVLDNLMKELQAAAERHSDSHVFARRGCEQNQHLWKCAKEEERLFHQCHH